MNYVEKVQIDLINSNRIYSVITMALGALLLYIFIKPTVETPAYTFWVCTILTVDTFRLAATLLYRDSKIKGQVNYDNAKLMILIGTIFSGACWGSVGFILMPVVEIHDIGVITLVLGALAVASTTTLSYQYHFSVIFVTLVLVSLALSFAGQKYLTGHDLLFVELVLAILMLFSLKNAKVLYKSYTQMLELQVRTHAYEKESKKERKKAETANRAKSVFLATMSHEIRTPINGIVGMVELLCKSALQPKQIQMLNVVKDSSLSLQRIIDDILDYSKIEAGKLDLEQVPISLQHQLESTSEILGPVATSRSVNLVTHVDEKLPETILADPVRLRQVLYNLVGNAIKFTKPSGIVQVDIIVSDISDESVAIEIIVSDTGIGMSMDDIDHLFKPFNQADKSSTRHYGGTGLGLSICKRLVDMMDGQIEVESVQGEGSRFHVKLDFPLVDTTAIEVTDLTDTRVLVVRAYDSPGNDYEDLLKSYISKAGATVESLSGKDKVILQAVLDSAHAGSPYDVVLICQQVASAYHYATYEALHAMPESERPPMVMLVPQADQNEYDDVATVHANPLYINKLLQCVAVMAGKMTSAEIKYCISGEPETRVVTASSDQRREERIETKEGLILLVEDNLVNQEVLNMQLSVLGYTAMMANDGREALALWEKHTFDLILTDCNMPEMDGFELATAIRKAETTMGTRVPIVAVTANAMSEELQECLDSGMDDCLTKPIELDNLSQAISKWIAVPT